MFQKKIHTKVTYDIPYYGQVKEYTLLADPKVLNPETSEESFELVLKSTYYTDRLPHDSPLVYEFRYKKDGVALTKILDPGTQFIYWEGTKYLWESKH